MTLYHDDENLLTQASSPFPPQEPKQKVNNDDANYKESTKLKIQLNF